MRNILTVSDIADAITETNNTDWIHVEAGQEHVSALLEAVAIALSAGYTEADVVKVFTTEYAAQIAEDAAFVAEWHTNRGMAAPTLLFQAYSPTIQFCEGYGYSRGDVVYPATR
jgi:hypothetical protein